ncbi:PAS domain-containing protein [Sulfurimonas sp.]|uniref:PAS domain-containing protein n=1 Tax=Sulfurimonas sp. TaxID=2022749 RepID=UPI003D139A4F
MSDPIKLSDIKPLVSRTDLKGNIKYANRYFLEICGYTEEELIGVPHNIIRHPDMPKVVFKIMWERLKQNKDILAVVKNKAKDGRHYWVTTLFETRYHPIHKTPEGYLAIRRAVPQQAIDTIVPLYQKLVEIEQKEGIKASEEYLLNYLRNQDIDYDTFIHEVVNYKGLVAMFFNKIRKLFQ